MKQMYASGPLEYNNLIWFLCFPANYTAEIFIFMSGLNYFEDDSGRGAVWNKPWSNAEMKKIWPSPGETLCKL